MSTVQLYFGSDKLSYSHFKTIKDGGIALCTSVKNIVEYSKQASEDSPAIILFEKTEIEKDVEILKEIKTKVPNSYIILVSDSIPREEFNRYIKYGVRDALKSRATKERYSNALEFVERNHKIITSTSRGQLSLGTYRVPLWKRIFDIILSVAAFVILSPVLIIVGVLIRIESPGPVIYKSKRVGSNYKEFDFFKFRSMYRDADKRLKEFLSLNQYNDVDLSHFNIEDDTARIPIDTENVLHDGLYFSDDDVITEEEFIKERSIKQKNNFVKFENDPRITKMGRFIRKYSIDELPQLINIIRGDMSIVGNRPLPLYEAEQLTSDQYIDRFMGPAGLTGLWQVEKRGDSGKLSPEERKQLDIYYANNFSFWLDLKIIIRTFTAFIQKENV
ncbi:MAG: glycosyl transferase [Bacteroidetes bacterium 41-46]|nr:MAG: glycosyl transferase [Bacteroidetes bacterium 41-46]